LCSDVLFQSRFFEHHLETCYFKFVKCPTLILNQWGVFGCCVTLRGVFAWAVVGVDCPSFGLQKCCMVRRVRGWLKVSGYCHVGEGVWSCSGDRQHSHGS